jgi:mRNA interferase RelE/StbE
MYQVIVEKRALKELLQIPRNYAKAIRTAIDDLASDPHPYGSIKLKGSDDEYRIRVGTYRVLYSVQDDIVTVTVFKIGHRKDVYE